MSESGSAARVTAALADRYHIERELGAGGMATVYLAQDLKHGRKVAIKVLRPELAAVIGAERFVREIRTIAALQHPHILGLIDSGELQGTAYYVMPFVEGESLRDRLTREKQLPINEAVRIAGEVASALDYAHRHGVIHRDIKPENILLHDGQALVADFGIALAASTAGGSRMTETGMSLGTPHYMSPEQAMGEREITARSDIYALGCVTYEMLVGEPPFTGPTAQAIVAKMMTEEPRPLAVQRKTVPPQVEDAVLTALAKLPADRFASAAEFAEALKGSGTTRVMPRPQQAARDRAQHRWLFLAGVVVVGLAMLAAWGWLRPATPGPAGVRKVDVVLPDSAPVEFIGEATIGVGQTAIAISPDGRTLAYIAGNASRPRIYVRPLDRFDATPLPGADGAFHPFFSPDGAWIGFFADNQLRKVPVAGGPVTTVAEANRATGGVWTRQGDILFTVDLGGGLRRVSAAGGHEVQLKTTRVGVGCTKSITLLPDERWVLCTAYADQAYGFLMAHSVDDGEDRVLVRDGVARSWHPGEPIPDDVLIGTTPLYRSGGLLYTRPDGTLLPIRFDPDRLRTSGEPVVVATGVRQESWTHQAQVAAASDGAIAYIEGSDAHMGVLAWLDRRGRVDTLPFPPANSLGTDISPDGSTIAVTIPAVSGNLELWLYDLRDRDRRRLLSNLGVPETRWTADGKYLIASLVGSVIIRANPARPGQVDTLAKASVYPSALTRDGRYLIGSPWENPVTGEDYRGTYRVALGGHVPPELMSYGGPAGGAFGLALSPDNLWVSYLGGGGGVFVEPYPPTGEIYRISGLDGDVPTWSRTGTEIFFASGSQLYVARVHPGSPPRFDPPQLIGSQRFANYAGRPYAVAPDEQRFLIKIPSSEHSAGSIRVILNGLEMGSASR